MYDDPAPVHTDKEIMSGWLDDELTWKDVYSKKPVEYLEAVQWEKHQCGALNLKSMFMVILLKFLLGWYTN
jgi:hypothetical protein